MIFNNLANILTLFRLVLLPVMVILMFVPEGWAAWLCLGLYVLGAVTDALDGWVARKFDQITAFGTFMDPISDKIYVVTIMVALIATDRVENIWIIPVLAILIREFLVSGLREYLGPKGIKVPVTDLAKWKTASQMVAVGVLLIAPFIPLGWAAGYILLLISAGLTVYTGWIYLKTGLEHMKEIG